MTAAESNTRVISNFLALGSGEAVSRLIAFGVTMYLARVLGPDGYGVIAFAIGVTLYLAKVADFGVEAAGANQIAASPDRVRAIASAVISARLAIAAMLAVLAVAVVWTWFPEPERSILSLYFLTLVPIAASTKWVHIGLERARPVGLARVLGEVLVLGLVLVCVRSAEQLWVVPAAQIAAECFVASFVFAVLVSRGLGFRLRWDLAAAIPLLKKGLPLFVQVSLGLLIYNSDLMFLRVLDGPAVVGYYAAAYTLISFAANLGMTYGMSLLPTLTTLRSRPTEETALFHTALAQTFAVALPIAIGAFLLAPAIIRLGFGAHYEGSNIALMILAVSIPFSALRNIPWVALIARERGNRLTSTMAWGVAGNLLLNLILVPRYGLVGAGIATVLTELVVCALMMRAVHAEGLRFVPFRRFLKPLAAGLTMAGALILFGPESIVPGALIGAGVFLASLTAFHGLVFHGWRLPTLNV